MNEFVVTVNNKKITVSLPEINKALINGVEFNFNLQNLTGSSYKFFVNHKSYLITSRRIGSNDFKLTINGKEIVTKALTSLQEKASVLLEAATIKHKSTIIKSPMPGLILKVKKKLGEDVKQGDSLLILEAMKMENDIRSPVSGKIIEIKAKEGQTVEKGIILLTIE